MTTTEFSNEFDIRYNSIATNSAPGLDLYEKSVYLTVAQLQLIKNYFNPKSNKYQEGFEQSTKRRNDLKSLIKNYNSYNPVTNFDNAISDNSVFFKIPSNVFLIIQEQAISVDKRLSCNNNKIASDILTLDSIQTRFNFKGKNRLKVIPKTHDEFNIQEDNPFRKPDKTKVWRLDYGYSPTDATLKTIELISEYNLYAYRVRYIEYPKPIILTDLDTLFPNEELSIDGETSEQSCILNESMHREILDRAVLLATGDYKPEELQLRAQINQNKE